MIKTYILTRPYHNYSFILRNKSGMKLRYDFTGGNSFNNRPARLILRSLYSQELLEASEEFKSGLVKLERTDEGGENAPKPEVPKTIVEDITSPEQLIEYVTINLEKPYKDPKAALNFAKSKGYEFPNLELKKSE